MKVIKLLGKKYDVTELEQNSKIVRKWYVIKQINKENIDGKYHVIENHQLIEETYNELIAKTDAETKTFYEKYLDENWKETYPIMKDVSAYSKIRPADGTEFCLLI